MRWHGHGPSVCTLVTCSWFVMMLYIFMTRRCALDWLLAPGRPPTCACVHHTCVPQREVCCSAGVLPHALLLPSGGCQHREQGTRLY